MGGHHFIANLFVGTRCSADRKRLRTLWRAVNSSRSLCLATMIGAFVHQLYLLSLCGTILMFVDMPFVTAGSAMLAWHYPLLGAIWMVVAGTIWWYLLSLLFAYMFKNAPRDPRKMREREITSSKYLTGRAIINVAGFYSALRNCLRQRAANYIHARIRCALLRGAFAM